MLAFKIYALANLFLCENDPQYIYIFIYIWSYDGSFSQVDDAEGVTVIEFQSIMTGRTCVEMATYSTDDIIRFSSKDETFDVTHRQTDRCLLSTKQAVKDVSRSQSSDVWLLSGFDDIFFYLLFVVALWLQESL